MAQRGRSKLLLGHAPRYGVIASVLLLGGCLISPKDYPLEAGSNGSGKGGGGSGGKGNGGASGIASGGKISSGGSAGNAGEATTGGISSAGTTGGAVGAECQSAADCDDKRPCTNDVCSSRGVCQHTPVTLPSKSKWITTASVTAGNAATCTEPSQAAANATDGTLATRWSSGKPQAGNEWVQVDFGTTVKVNKLLLEAWDPALDCGGPDDHPRHVVVRVSDTANNLAGPIATEVDGTLDLTTIEIPDAVEGRYLLLSQTGVASPSWWSIAELEAMCEDL